MTTPPRITVNGELLELVDYSDTTKPRDPRETRLFWFAVVEEKEDEKDKEETNTESA